MEGATVRLEIIVISAPQRNEVEDMTWTYR